MLMELYITSIDRKIPNAAENLPEFESENTYQNNISVGAITIINSQNIIYRYAIVF